MGETSRGSQLGRFPRGQRWPWEMHSSLGPVQTAPSDHSSHQFGAAPCWLPGKRCQPYPHFSTLRAPGSVFPHILHGTNGLFPPPGTASSSPTALLLGLTLCFTLSSFPSISPPFSVPCLSSMASDQGWFPSLLRR